MRKSEYLQYTPNRVSRDIVSRLPEFVFIKGNDGSLSYSLRLLPKELIIGMLVSGVVVAGG